MFIELDTRKSISFNPPRYLSVIRISSIDSISIDLLPEDFSDEYQQISKKHSHLASVATGNERYILKIDSKDYKYAFVFNTEKEAMDFAETIIAKLDVIRAE